MFTLKKLMSNTPPEVKLRAKLCSSKVHAHSAGKKFDEYKYLVRCTDGYRQATIRDFTQGGMTPTSDVWVSCTCPYWLFYCEWAVAKRTGKPPSTNIIYCNGRPPYIRNPRFTPYLCKHLYHVTRHLKRDARRIEKGRMPKLTKSEQRKLEREQKKEERALGRKPKGPRQASVNQLDMQLDMDIMVLLLQEPSSYRVIEEFNVDNALIAEIKEALHRLREQGYIRKVGKDWEITDAGIEYLAREL